MTLLGELYANGYGVAQDDKKALAWFSLAADRGDREAIFALAMFALRRPRRPAATATRPRRCSTQAAKLGHVAAAYNLALLYLEGQQVRQDFARAAELLRGAADAGSPEAQYALATLYKEGSGVPKDGRGAPGCSRRGARRQYRGRGRIRHRAVQRHRRRARTRAAAAALFRRAARKGNPIAQNRLARI